MTAADGLDTSLAALTILRKLARTRVLSCSPQRPRWGDIDPVDGTDLCINAPAERRVLLTDTETRLMHDLLGIGEDQ